jgi:hypothetical protein
LFRVPAGDVANARGSFTLSQFPLGIVELACEKCGTSRSPDLRTMIARCESAGRVNRSFFLLVGPCILSQNPMTRLRVVKPFTNRTRIGSRDFQPS